MNRPSYQIEICRVNKRIRELQQTLEKVTRRLESTSEALRTGNYQEHNYNKILRLYDACYFGKSNLEVEIAELEERISFHWG